MTAAALDLLLGASAPAVLQPAVAEYGGRLRAAVPASATVRPDGAVLVRYRAQARRADGRSGTEVLVAATGSAIVEGATVVTGEHLGVAMQVGLWRWPQDPALPGVALLADPAAGLRRLGLASTGPLHATVRAYRPGQRAVVELRDSRHTRFVKIVRPAAVTGLRRRHDLLAPCLPVPPVLACGDDGVIVLPRAPGIPMRDAITGGDALPRPEQLEALLAQLPDCVLSLPRRRGPLERVEDTEAILRLTAASQPDLLARLPRLVDGLRSWCPDEPEVPVHGDFYEGQLLVDDGRVTGLLDVDTVGPGRRGEEWATIIGHLCVAGLRSARAASYADEIFEFACRRGNPETLRKGIAAVVLGLATGPFRACHPAWPHLTAQRLDLAARWLSG